VPKRCHRRFSRRCLLGRLRGDLAPKRCHSRPSPRCLLGQLGNDVMPKPCHRRLSPGAYRPADTCRHARSWHAVRVIVSVSAQPTLADRLGTLAPRGTWSASSSPSPPSRHLPTVGPARSSVGHRQRSCSAYRPAGTCRHSSAHSFLARGPRHPHRLRPADTCRDSRHTAPVDGHYTRQCALRNQSPGLADRGQIR
jgi:hypothetical protein